MLLFVPKVFVGIVRTSMFTGVNNM